MTTITATPLPELSAVRLEVTGAPAGPLDIVRTDVNGRRLVRQASGQVTSAGALVIVDYEPAQLGSLGYLADGVYTTTTLEPTAQPRLARVGRPSTSLELLAVETFDETSTAPALAHQVYDRADPIVVSGPLSARTGQLGLHCASYTDARQVRELFAVGDVVQLRQPTFDGLDLYLTANRVRLAPHSADVDGPAHWLATVDYAEVSAPSSPLLDGAAWTYADLKALVPTYAALKATFPTYYALTVGP